MSWPSILGSLAGTESGLRATGDGEAAGDAAGDAAGEAAGLAAAPGEGLAAAAGLADAVGLNSGDLRAALTEDRYRARVDEQFEFARAAGVTGVPAYLAGRYMMVGAQPYEVFCKLIETAQAEDEVHTPSPP